MKMKLTYPMVLALLYAFVGAVAANAQTTQVSGRVTDNDQPQAGVQVIYKSSNTGRVIKIKTNNNGEFSAIGVPDDVYTVTVIDASGKTIFTHDRIAVAEGGDNAENVLTIDITKGVTVKTAKGAAMGGVGPKTSEFHGADAKDSTAGTRKEGRSISKEEMDKLKAEREKAVNLNALIAQYNAAQQVKNWQQAADLLKQMIAAAPDRWEYMKALGDMQINLGQYEDAIASYEKATLAAKNDSKTDANKTKAAVEQIVAKEGAAYFNLCATDYNSGKTQEALGTCDKAIAADPNRPDAYFIKGSLMMADSKQGKDGKLEAAPGTAEALNKYLELAPDGPHANDVKQMLAFIGAKVETTYHEKKKK
ncbi:MAG: carboxypeptidase regulatory-like domain-containing protein [Candidatus Angelobacter sp.]